MKDKIKVGDSRPTFLQLCRNSRIPKLEFLKRIPKDFMPRILDFFSNFLRNSRILNLEFLN